MKNLKKYRLCRCYLEKINPLRAVVHVMILGFFIFGCTMMSWTMSWAEPSPLSSVWLERKSISLRSMAQKPKEASKNESSKNEDKKDVHKKDSSSSDNKKEKKKRRRPMSRPASYFLKSGDFPDAAEDSSCLLDSICWLKKPDKSYNRLLPQKKEDGVLIYDDALQAGLYQLHLYYSAGVKDETWYRYFSSVWFRNSGEDDFEEKESDQKDLEGLYQGNPLFYLKELTEDEENNFVSQKRNTGDMLPVQVLLEGKPVAGVPVTLTTGKGWQKTIITDEAGKVSFLLIKEVFHDKKVYKSPEPYLIKAVHTIEKEGSVGDLSYKKETFTATIRLMVYPTPYDWKSKSAGFYVFAGSILAVSFGAAIRRKRSQAI